MQFAHIAVLYISGPPYPTACIMLIGRKKSGAALSRSQAENGAFRVQSLPNHALALSEFRAEKLLLYYIIGKK